MAAAFLAGFFFAAFFAFGRAGASGIAITVVDWADVHRWKMINKTLDLPFPEPQETYSTSEHLFHDQGIPAGTKGRIVDPAPVEKKERPQRERGSRDGGSRDGGSRDGGTREKASGDAPRRRTRSRSRTRGGAPVKDTQA